MGRWGPWNGQQNFLPGSETSSQHRERPLRGPARGHCRRRWEDGGLAHRFCLTRGWSWWDRGADRRPAGCAGGLSRRLRRSTCLLPAPAPQPGMCQGRGLLPLEDLSFGALPAAPQSGVPRHFPARAGALSARNTRCLQGSQQAGGRPRAACTGTEAPATPLGVHRPHRADAVLTDRTDSLGGKTDDGASPGYTHAIASACVAAKTNATSEAPSQSLGFPCGLALVRWPSPD